MQPAKLCWADIPIRNVYFLLHYVWDALEREPPAEAGLEDIVEPRELLARELVERTRRIWRRGLDRGYVEEREDTKCLRGRVDLQQTAKRLLERKAMAHVVYEEFSADVPINQVVRAATRAMIHVIDLDPNWRDACYSNLSLLREISDRRLSADLFRHCRLHRNNREYRVLLDVCRMIHDRLLPLEHGDEMLFPDFRRDENFMRRLFQRFVFNFLAREQKLHRVDAPTLCWASQEECRRHPIALPIMKTDIVLTDLRTHAHQIIDTKFYAEPFDGSYGSMTIKSDHLFQMWAYVTALQEEWASASPVEGMLLYPATEGRFEYEWTIRGHRIRAASLDLGQESAGIRRDLLRLVGVEEAADAQTTW